MKLDKHGTFIGCLYANIFIPSFAQMITPKIDDNIISTIKFMM